MTREQVKELLPIIQAFAEGKKIEVKPKEGSRWCKFEDDDIHYLEFEKCDFRIKPTYRPFNNTGECWNEMQKHQPFGFVKDKKVNDYYIIDGVYYSDNFNCPVASMSGEVFTYKKMIDNYLFADGTPFGIKED